MAKNQQMTTEASMNKKDFRIVKALILIAVSFIIAFLVQLTVHELGHYIAGLVVGAKGGQVILHPFYNSKVIFNDTPGMTAEIIVGIAGPIIDIIFATLIGFILWHKRNVKWLPLLMWGSIAYIGEGIGMLSSLAVYPQFIEDITQLLRVGVPQSLIVVVSVAFVLIGLVWMILVIQMSGIAENEKIGNRFLAYLCSLPLYFALSILDIKVFKPFDYDILDVRIMQMQISIVLALLLTLFHQPMIHIMKYFHISREQGKPMWSDVIFLSTASGLIVLFMLGYSHLFNLI